jgi:hypothetical protein
MQAEEGPQEGPRKVGRPRIINYSRMERGQTTLLQSVQMALNGGSIQGSIHALIQEPLPSIELNAEEEAEAQIQREASMGL